MWNLIHCEWWDFEIGEFGGTGRCIASYRTKAQAIERAQAWAGVARESWGSGVVAVTDQDSKLVALIDNGNPEMVIEPADAGQLIAA